LKSANADLESDLKQTRKENDDYRKRDSGEFYPHMPGTLEIMPGHSHTIGEHLKDYPKVWSFS